MKTLKFIVGVILCLIAMFLAFGLFVAAIWLTPWGGAELNNNAVPYIIFVIIIFLTGIFLVADSSRKDKPKVPKKNYDTLTPGQKIKRDWENS